MSDQAGVQDVGANAGDLDDDDGGGLVCIPMCSCTYPHYAI